MINEEDDTQREDCEPMRRAPRPYQPTPREVEDHNETHYPPRSWCKFCVRGKSLGQQRGHGLRESDVPIVACDYFYITAAGELGGRSDLEKLGYMAGAEGDVKILEDRRSGQLVKCILTKCFKFKVIWAHVIPVKGMDEDGFVVDLVTSDISWLGHTRVIVKSDNEPALVKLVDGALVALRVKDTQLEPASKEHSPEYDSQANGGVENGIKNFRAQFRTMRLCFEARIGKKLPISHALIAWLVEHTSLLMNAVFLEVKMAERHGNVHEGDPSTKDSLSSVRPSSGITPRRDRSITQMGTWEPGLAEVYS